MIQADDYSFSYNPFGNLVDSELTRAIVPRSFLEDILAQLKQRPSILIELVGAKGRGKTTHLRLLQQLLPDSFYLRPNRQEKPALPLQMNRQTILLVDSIHHYSLIERQKIYRHFSHIVLTTHSRRSLEYRLARKPYASHRFSGLDAQTLNDILQKRIRLAAHLPLETEVPLDSQLIHKLIHRFGDDLRAILHHLYEQFDPKAIRI